MNSSTRHAFQRRRRSGEQNNSDTSTLFNIGSRTRVEAMSGNDERAKGGLDVNGRVEVLYVLNLYMSACSPMLTPPPLP